MPSERKIRKLYVNGRTICIEFFFCLFQILASAGCVAVTDGAELGGVGDYPSTSVLAGRKPAKIANMYMFALLAKFVLNLI